MVALLFYFLALITLAGAITVAFSKNIVHSAFGLMASMLGVAGFYAYMSADFLMVTQLIVYVGGIIILALFAVMFTGDIRNIKESNKKTNTHLGFMFISVVAIVIILAQFKAKFPSRLTSLHNTPTTEKIGDLLLSSYLLPFELISILLFSVLLGSVYIARKKKKDAR